MLMSLVTYYIKNKNARNGVPLNVSNYLFIFLASSPVLRVTVKMVKQHMGSDEENAFMTVNIKSFFNLCTSEECLSC